MSNTHLSSSLLASLVLAGFAVGQGSRRAPVTGTVVDTSGQLWVGATVHLHSRPVPGVEWIGTADRLEVTTDGDGRFTAQVLRDREYLVWAVAAAGEDRYRTTRPRSRVLAGQTIELVEQDQLARVRFRIQGRGDKPLTMKVTNGAATGCRSLLLAAQPTDDFYVFEHPLSGRTGEMPWLPWPVCRVELFDGLERVFDHNVTMSVPWRRAALASPRPAAPPAWSVDNPQSPPDEKIVSMTENVLRIERVTRCRYKLLGADGGRLKSGELGLRLRGRYLPITKLGPIGRAKLPEPFYDYRWSRAMLGIHGAELVFRAPGHADFPPLVTAAAESSLNRRQLRPGHTLTGQILLGGRPLANTSLLVHVSSRYDLDRGPNKDPIVGIVTTGTQIHTTDANGKFEIPGLSVDYLRSIRIVAVLDDVQLAHLRGPWPGRLDRRVIVAERSIAPHGWDWGLLEVSSVRKLRVVARRPDGSPVPYARVVLFSPELAYRRVDKLVDTTADADGRVAVMLGVSRPLTALVVGPESVSAKPVPVDAKRFEVRLDPAREISGTVVDRDGKPFPGVVVAAEPNLGLLSKADPKAATRYLAKLLRDRVQATSDAKGRFRVLAVGDAETVAMRMSLANPFTKAEQKSKTLELGDKSATKVELVYDPNPAAEAEVGVTPLPKLTESKGPVFVGRAGPKPAVDAVRYDIKAKLRRGAISATVLVDIETSKPTTKLAFELAPEMKINDVVSFGFTLKPVRSGSKVELDVSKLELGPGGSARLRFDIEGKPHGAIDGRVQASTTEKLCYATSAYAWYPRIPNDLATYRTTLLVPPSWVGEAPGVDTREFVLLGEGEPMEVLREFRVPTPPIGFFLVEPEVVHWLGLGRTSTVDACAVARQAHVRGLLEEAKSAFVYFNRALGGIDGQSLSFLIMPSDFGVRRVQLGTDLAFSSSDALGESCWAAREIADETSRLWWGSYVSSTDFTCDVLAAYWSLRYVEAKHGAEAARETRQQLARDVKSTSAADEAIASLEKAEREIGRENFDKAMTDLLRKHPGKVIDWTVVEAALGASRRSSKRH